MKESNTQRRSRLKRTGEYQQRLINQGFRCMICKLKFVATVGSKGPIIDHCHFKGHVRGILCHNCNKGLGNFKDSPNILRKAALYLELFS